MPPSRCSPVTAAISRAHSPRDQPNELDYDVPPRAIPVTDGAFRNCPRCSPQPPPSCVSPASRDSGEAYDVPRSLLSKCFSQLLYNLACYDLLEVIFVEVGHFSILLLCIFSFWGTLLNFPRIPLSIYEKKVGTNESLIISDNPKKQ